MSSTNLSTDHVIESSDVWQAVRSLGLYSRADMELDALIAQHRGGELRVDQVTAEAARHVRELRRALATGRFM
jgi:hypothetical protein